MINRTNIHKNIVQEGPVVSPVQAAWLLTDYTPDDVKNALFSILNDRKRYFHVK